MPCNESASTMGVDELLTYGSMHCVRASVFVKEKG
jgi:hypothetical protein